MDDWSVFVFGNRTRKTRPHRRKMACLKSSEKAGVIRSSQPTPEPEATSRPFGRPGQCRGVWRSTQIGDAVVARRTRVGSVPEVWVEKTHPNHFVPTRRFLDMRALQRAWSNNHLFPEGYHVVLATGAIVAARAKRAALYPRSQHGRTDGRKPAACPRSRVRAARWRLCRRMPITAYRVRRGDTSDQADALLKDASRGKFDVVVAWALDRLGRSLIVCSTRSGSWKLLAWL